MDKLKNLIEAVANVPENAWGFLVLMVAAMLAVLAHTTGDKDLFGSAAGFAMTGAAIMHAKKD
jgi:hypothetical protein